MRLWVKIGLFLSSYAPLFLILAILEYTNDVIGKTSLFGLELSNLSICFTVIALFGLLTAIFILGIANQQSPTLIKPTNIDKDSAETLSYLITYLVPFIGFKFDGIASLVADVILIAMICYLYIQSNMIFINPLFSLLGYSVYKVKLNGANKLMLARTTPQKDNNLKAVILAEGLYVESRK